MIIRKLHENERKRAAELSSLVFEYSFDSSKTAEEFYQETRDNPNSREDFSETDKWAAFQDDDQTLMAAVSFIPYKANFDGRDMVMSGVGGVSTFPQYRREGCIRSIFEKALPDLYAKGVSFSYLYPFSTAFYRKFGYEVCCEYDRLDVKMSGLPRKRTNGYCRLLEKDTDFIPDMIRIYSH